tara:strand:- start:828 stop:1115 length:288 start_codon:yes stop_codon:yes gene_type:complete
MSEIEQIVKDHKGGKVPYHVALDKIVDLGMVQMEAHELLFPPIGDDDFDPDLPFDPTDIMTVDLSKAMSKLEGKNYKEGGIYKVKNLKINMGEEE